MTDVKNACALPQLIAFVPTANHVLDSGVECRLSKTYE